MIQIRTTRARTWAYCDAVGSQQQWQIKASARCFYGPWDPSFGRGPECTTERLWFRITEGRSGICLISNQVVYVHCGNQTSWDCNWPEIAVDIDKADCWYLGRLVKLWLHKTWESQQSPMRLMSHYIVYKKKVNNFWKKKLLFLWQILSNNLSPSAAHFQK